MFFRNVNKREAISWAFYDFANSAYSVLILSFVFPIFFREVVAGGDRGDFWWGFAVSMSILLAGLASPIVGAMADHDARKKRKFIIFGGLSMVGTAALFATGPNMLLAGLALFIVTNLCFGIAQTLYDSFLVHVSTEETSGRISGLGWGLGYLGGVVAMLALKPLYNAGYEHIILYKLTFPMTALFFLIFALPSFLFIKEHKRIVQKETLARLVRIGISNTLRTIRNIKAHKEVAWFLVGFYILNDALVTIFAFVPIYARTTLGMNFSEITALLLIVQLIGFPAAILFGWLSDGRGSKKILLFTIVLWASIVLGISFATTKLFLYAMSVLSGMVIGSSQAIARSWFTKMIPREQAGEFFGFNGFASKVAATTGPLFFGIISSVTHNQRLAMGSLAIYFVISFVIFARIRDVKPRDQSMQPSS